MLGNVIACLSFKLLRYLCRSHANKPKLMLGHVLACPFKQLLQVLALVLVGLVKPLNDLVPRTVKPCGCLKVGTASLTILLRSHSGTLYVHGRSVCP